MKNLSIAMILALVPPPQEADWNPTRDASKAKGLADVGRTADVYQHGTRKEWGYPAPQQDTFIVIHPKVDRKNPPLYVVLHSA